MPLRVLYIALLYCFGLSLTLKSESTGHIGARYGFSPIPKELKATKSTQTSKVFHYYKRKKKGRGVEVSSPKIQDSTFYRYFYSAFNYRLHLPLFFVSAIPTSCSERGPPSLF